MKKYINRLLQFDRGELNEEAPIGGFVLDYNDDRTLLQNVERDMFLNGYAAIRNDTVRSFRELDDYDFLVQRALKNLGYNPIKPDGVDLTSLGNIVLTANRIFPLITIHREVLFKGECHIGSIAKVTAKTLVLSLINPGALYGGPYRIRLADVTKVEFDGHYERAL